MSGAARWERLTREEVVARAPESVLVLPVGATEQHGPHLATGTDTLLCTAVADAAAARAGTDAVVAPALAVGASAHHLPFGGTLSLSPDTLAAVLRDVIASAVSAGFRRVLLLNGHGGNTAACRDAAAAGTATHNILVEARCYWDGVEFEGPATAPGHAGQFETSLALAVAPESVRPELARPSPGTGPWGQGPASPERWREIDGFTDDPTSADAADGARWLEACVASVAGTIQRLGRAAV